MPLYQEPEKKGREKGGGVQEKVGMRERNRKNG